VNDWYYGDAEYAWPMGNIQMTGKTRGAIMKCYAPLETFLMPQWSMDQIAEHALDFWLTTEDLPDPSNRVTVDGNGQIHLQYQVNNQTSSNHLWRRLQGVLDRLYQKKHLVERQAYVKTQWASRRWAIRRAPVASAATRPAPCSMCTARPTNSTISMW
jgi:hypothetical protein